MYKKSNNPVINILQSMLSLGMHSPKRLHILHHAEASPFSVLPAPEQGEMNKLLDILLFLKVTLSCCFNYSQSLVLAENTFPFLSSPNSLCSLLCVVINTSENVETLMYFSFVITTTKLQLHSYV
jgi:hypothetical protein